MNDNKSQSGSLTGKSPPPSQPPRTASEFWYAGSAETAGLPSPSCTDSSDAHSHGWLWNLALRRKKKQEIKTLFSIG